MQRAVFGLFPFLLPAIVALLVQPVRAADDWVDSFYQFRLPVEVEAEAVGWQVLPIDAERITREINRVGPFRFDPHYLAFNHLKLVEVDESGKAIDSRVDGGFTLVSSGPELAAEVLAGKADKKTIAVTPGRYHLMRFTSSGGGKCPALAYEPIFPPGTPLRKHVYRISYFPPLLPQPRRTHDVLFVPDGKAMELLVRGRFIGTIHDISVRAAEIRLMANITRAGTRRYHVYYQPMGSHHLQVPRRRREQVPVRVATLRSVGAATEYTGDTRYRVGDSESVRTWFAESTVKMTRKRRPPRQIRRGVRVTAAANESQSFQLVLTPRRATTLDSITLSALAGSDRMISMRTAEVKLVEYVPIRTGSFITPARVGGDVGDPLLPLDHPVKARLLPGRNDLGPRRHQNDLVRAKVLEQHHE